MKQLIIFAFSGILMLSCSTNEDDVKKIDQTLNIYLRTSSGQDLLNDQIINSYSSFSAQDVNGLTASTNVNFQKAMDEDSLFYLKYIAGARRIKVDSLSSNDEIYSSKIAFSFNQKTSETTTQVVKDTMEVLYRDHSAIFEVSRVLYNHHLVFEKQSSEPNTVIIIK